MDVARTLKRMLGRPGDASLEEQAYTRLAAKGYRPAGIIDIGAYHGNWTRLVRRVLGDIPTLMIEAQPSRREHLDRTVAELADVRYVSALLSETAGEAVTFYEMETGSSLLPERSNAPRATQHFTTETLDGVAADVPGPLFLKVDVQGAELQVLRGGNATLRRADLVQLEVAVIPYNDGAPTMLEVLSFMNDKGFVPYDLSGLTRPTGTDLAQVDMLFTRPDSPLRPERFVFAVDGNAPAGG